MPKGLKVTTTKVSKIDLSGYRGVEWPFGSGNDQNLTDYNDILEYERACADDDPGQYSENYFEDDEVKFNIELVEVDEEGNEIQLGNAFASPTGPSDNPFKEADAGVTFAYPVSEEEANKASGPGDEKDDSGANTTQWSSEKQG